MAAAATAAAAAAAAAASIVPGSTLEGASQAQGPSPPQSSYMQMVSGFM
jgi:hypothetical protein